MWFLLQLLSSATAARNSCRQYRSEWVWLISNKTLFIKTNGGWGTSQNCYRQFFCSYGESPPTHSSRRWVHVLLLCHLEPIPPWQGFFSLKGAARKILKHTCDSCFWFPLVLPMQSASWAERHFQSLTHHSNFLGSKTEQKEMENKEDIKTLRWWN